MKYMTFLITLIGSLFLIPTGLVAQVQPQCEVGIWFPYQSNDGVPSPASFAARGMNVTFLAGNIDATVLATYEVLFLGRTGMISAAAIEDIDAVIQWVSNGGGIMGESESLIHDSDSHQAADWSSRLSVVAGVSSTYPDGGDSAISNPTITVTAPAHQITQGLPASFSLTGSHAQENYSLLDLAKNPTAVEVATSNSNPIIAAEFGGGRSVYFPTAVGYSGMDWAANTEYETLFLNAVEWACGGMGVEAAKPVPAMNSSTVAILTFLLLIAGITFIRRPS